MLLVAAPGAAGAQVFLASRPNPEFMVGPLFVRLAVTPELGVTLDVLWSLVVPPNKSGAAIAQDLYLLWPNSVGASTEGAPDPALAAYVTARGFTPIREGRLPLFAQSLYRIGEDQGLFPATLSGKPLEAALEQVLRWLDQTER